MLILGGITGNKFLEQKDVLEIAALPSLDEVRAQLISLIQTPARNIAYALKFSANKLVRVFNEYSKLDISDQKTETEAKTDEKPEIKENDTDNKKTVDK